MIGIRKTVGQYSEVLVKGFQKPFRKDSNVLHGGLIIYVKENITYICRNDLENSRFHSIMNRDLS